MTYVYPHAIDRFIERVDASLSRDAAKERILAAAPAIQKAAVFGCGCVRLPSGARLILDGEMLHPSRKCARLGHAMQDREALFFRWPSDHGWSFVADEIVETTPTCRRCGHTGETVVEVERRLIGLTMSSDAMRTLRKNGKYPR